MVFKEYKNQKSVKITAIFNKYKKRVNYENRSSRLHRSKFSENKVDYVVNFVAESHVDKSIENPQIFLETNI